jgi:CRP/FNR family transcriptional regulator
VKLSTSSSLGKTLILRMAESGEVLGLPATVTGKPYELTAEVAEPTQANFVTRADFLAFLSEYGEAALRVAQQLGENYHSAIAEMRTIGLSSSAADKVARFLLELSNGDAKEKSPVTLHLTLTHEEIAQRIGSARETVTRVLADFKKREIIQVKGASLTLRDREALAKIAGI